MMQQYLKIKEEYKDCILFYRLGDFYEMFFDDAKTCTEELGLTLTGKSCGLEERAPMCGVPFHSVDSYLDKLVKSGYKVAICEQVEDPKDAKGVVKREVIRVATPGTNISMESLDETSNNYIMSIYLMGDITGLSYADITTGDFYVTELDSTQKVTDEIYKVMPSEIICNNSFLISEIDFEHLRDKENIAVNALEDYYFDEKNCINAIKKHFNVENLNGLGLLDYPIGTIASGVMLEYLNATQKNDLSHIDEIHPYSISKYMVIDRATRRNLELTETLRDKEKRGSLFWVLDKSKTAMGARLIRNSITEPLIEKADIIKRHNAIESMNKNAISREELREYLSGIYDLERLITKISYNSANPRDLIALKTSLAKLPHVKVVLSDFEDEGLKELKNSMDSLEDITELIESAINEEPPLTLKEGDIIKPGYNADVDRLRTAATEGKNWLYNLLEEEKEKTGIKNLKLKYNKVFGYYIEVTNSYKDLVPEDWIRKQTLVNAERYMTPKLKELEETILGSTDKLNKLEYDLFSEIRDSIFENIKRIKNAAKIIAYIDMIASFAVIAEKNNYVKPTINEEGYIDIKGGRHPVVEKMTGNDQFIENDTFLDNDNNRISIITGPNMAGKSTYMRQTALIVLMAQIGSFVPASEADICIVDRIFTRVGASDDLASGMSTFMVEMTEVANILRNATKNSLIILDEIGRGTSTYDGLAIAWAVVEYISDEEKIGAKTLFATHYHELTELEGKLESVNNYCIAVKEKGDNVIFLRKIIKGGADKSYGIHVAGLAGVPTVVLDRANEIVEDLVKNNLTEKLKDTVRNNKGRISKKSKKKPEDAGQLSMFDDNFFDNTEILHRIRNMDLSAFTPIDALNTLYSLQKELKERM
ncbi:MAG: DNA mismatch repair protein MutS [Lachnospiraceae bacterium]|nr:DNA mismatch repair protein MutS [Lachnospiraceae bacterium]